MERRNETAGNLSEVDGGRIASESCVFLNCSRAMQASWWIVRLSKGERDKRWVETGQIPFC